MIKGGEEGEEGKEKKDKQEKKGKTKILALPSTKSSSEKQLKRKKKKRKRTEGLKPSPQPRLPSLKRAHEDIFKQKRHGRLVDIRNIFSSKNFSSKLTRAQRNKLERLKLLKRELRHQKTEDRRMRDIERIPQLLGNMEKKDKKSEAKQEYNKEKEKQRDLTQPKKLSKYRFEDLPKLPLLTEELPGRLRLLPKPKTNLFTERFLSFQKRNIIETRVPIRYRYQKVMKVYTRGSMRD